MPPKPKPKPKRKSRKPRKPGQTYKSRPIQKVSQNPKIYSFLLPDQKKSTLLVPNKVGSGSLSRSQIVLENNKSCLFPVLVSFESKNQEINFELNQLKISWILTQDDSKKTKQKQHLHFSKWVLKPVSFAFPLLESLKKKISPPVFRSMKQVFDVPIPPIGEVSKDRWFFTEVEEKNVAFLFQKKTSYLFQNNITKEQKKESELYPFSDFKKTPLSAEYYVQTIFEIVWLLADLWNSFCFIHGNLWQENFLFQAPESEELCTKIFYHGLFETTKKVFKTESNYRQLFLSNFAFSYLYDLPNKNWLEDILVENFRMHPIHWWYSREGRATSKMNLDFYALAMFSINLMNENKLIRIWRYLSKSIGQQISSNFFAPLGLDEKSKPKKNLIRFIKSCGFLLYVRESLGVTHEENLKEFTDFCHFLQKKEKKQPYFEPFIIQNWIALETIYLAEIKNKAPVQLSNISQSSNPNFLSFLRLLTSWNPDDILYDEVLEHKFFLPLVVDSKSLDVDQKHVQYFQMSPPCSFAFRKKPELLLKEKWKITYPPQKTKKPVSKPKSTRVQSNRAKKNSQSILREPSVSLDSEGPDIPVDLDDTRGLDRKHLPDRKAQQAQRPQQPAQPPPPLRRNLPRRARQPQTRVARKDRGGLGQGRVVSRLGQRRVVREDRGGLGQGRVVREDRGGLGQGRVVIEERGGLERGGRIVRESKTGRTGRKLPRPRSFKINLEEKKLQNLEEKAPLLRVVDEEEEEEKDEKDEKKREVDSSFDWKKLGWQEFKKVKFVSTVERTLKETDKPLLVIWNLLNKFVSDEDVSNNVCRVFARAFREPAKKLVFIFSASSCAILAAGKELLHVFVSGDVPNIEQTLKVLLENRTHFTGRSKWRLYINPQYWPAFPKNQGWYLIQKKGNKKANGPPAHTANFLEWFKKNVKALVSGFLALDKNVPD